MWVQLFRIRKPALIDALLIFPRNNIMDAGDGRILFISGTFFISPQCVIIEQPISLGFRVKENHYEAYQKYDQL